MKTKTTLFFIFVFFQTLMAAERVDSDHLSVQLISEVSGINGGTPFDVAVLFELEEHWHIYWQNPGDAGLAPQFTWTLPPGFQIGEIQWPYPHKIMVGGLANYGYENEVLLSAQVIPPPYLQAGAKIDITVQVEWLVCKEECIPGEASLAISLPVSEQVAKIDQLWQEEFYQTRSQYPLLTSDWQVSSSIQGASLYIDLQPPDWYKPEMQQIVFFPLPQEVIDNAAEQVLKRTTHGYRLQVPLNPMRMADPDSIAGVLVAENGWRGEGSEKALLVNLIINEAALPSGLPLSDIALALFFAFLGGIILNVMPCVLPVLSLKILSFVQQAGEDRKKVFQHGLIFTIGVVASFLLLALILILLRAGGEELGWGFQLQSPAFILILSAFLFLFALNLFGVFEIGTSVMGLGQNLAGRTGRFGSFMSGVTATVVATPCTAPFMGSALGFALTQPNTVSLMIFAALGMGMAFPYLLLSSLPGLLKFIPKPGAWMESLKQFMGFLLMATIIWLAWVYGLQTGPDGIIMLLVCLLLIGLAAWIVGRWSQLHIKKTTRILVRALALLIISAAVSLGLTTLKPQRAAGSRVEKHDGLAWQTYSDEKLNKALAAGQSVFIDFTAAWCLSCQVNERVALANESVQQKFNEMNILALKADWTQRDEYITRALARYGRNSVPLYVIHHSPDLQDRIILPEIISAGIVIEALEKIKIAE